MNNSLTYGTRMINAAFTAVLQKSLSSAESTQSLRLTPIYLRLILIVPSHLHIAFRKRLFPVGLPVNILKALLPCSILAICPAHFNVIQLMTLNILGERNKL